MSWTARELRIPSTVDPLFQDHSHKQGFIRPFPLKLYCLSLLTLCTAVH